jgi:hypothetical protein
MANIVAISRETIVKRYPAVYAENPAGHTSPNYQFVNTGKLVDDMLSNGWEAIQVSQQKVRSADRKESTKHQVTLRLRDWPISLTHLGGLYPAVRFINSHDWSSKLILSFMMMRLVCGNGLSVVGNQFMGANLRHDSALEDLHHILARIQEHATLMFAIAEKWHGIKLDSLQLMDFAMKAAEIRFEEKGDDMRARALLTIRRPEDAENTLWNAYNRVQENATKGGVKEKGMDRSVRALTNIQTSHDVNTSLFQLATQFAKGFAT